MTIYPHKQLFEDALSRSEWAPNSSTTRSLIAYDLAQTIGNKIDPTRLDGPRDRSGILLDLEDATVRIQLHRAQERVAVLATAAGAGLIALAVLLLPLWLLGIGIPLLVLGVAALSYMYLTTHGITRRSTARRTRTLLQQELADLPMEEL